MNAYISRILLRQRQPEILEGFQGVRLARVRHVGSRKTMKRILDTDYLIARADFCSHTCFGFFGLPAGAHELSIDARGYKSVVKTYSVAPGIPEYFRATELTPD